MRKSNEQYFPQLDSLRAIAVLLVIISHWFSSEHFLNRFTTNGILGVTLFFVLSGFLITGILLKSKTKLETGGSLREAFKVFYMRRSLRIFPVYYLLLGVLFVFNMASIRESFWWHFSYNSNFYFWLKNSFDGSLSHLWSLAVEEQFYLVWPAIILLVPRRFLTFVLIGGVLTSVLFRLIIVTDSSEMGRLLMPGSLDSFCIGGLLAFGRLNEINWYKKYLQNQTIFIFFAFGLITLVHLPFFKHLPRGLNSSFYFLFISVAFGILINRVSYSVNTPVLKKVLNNKILLYIGKISYGVYLFHNFVPYFYDVKLFFISASLSLYVINLFRFLILITLASFSWYFVEKPFLSLKKRYEFS